MTQSEMAAYKAGHDDATLAQLVEHSKAVNGSIEKGAQAQATTAAALTALAGDVRELRATLRTVARIIVWAVPPLIAAAVAVLLKFN